MIFVRRGLMSLAVREALTKQVRGATELERARTHYASVPAPTKAYDFVRYREHAVCVALDAMFHEKCAYCETKYAAADARNVEHYRPKGGVTEDPDHPGYWWLASDWDNLLPSCPACNQRRYQVIFDAGMSLEEFDIAYLEEPSVAVGKGNSFPMLMPGAWVREEQGDLSAEDPLLIQPTLRDPVEHLEWVFDWDRSMYLWEAELLVSVRPRVVRGQQDIYGKASIAVYGLNRSGLARDRMGLLKLLQTASADIVYTLGQIACLPAAYTAGLERRLEELKGRLDAHSAAKAPYAGMARAYIALFDEELQRLSEAAR